MEPALLDRRPAVLAAVEFRVLDDMSAVAVDREGGTAHALNPVAAAILERCDGEATVREIVAEIEEIFDGPPERVAAEVAAFVDELAAMGLIAW